LALHGATPESHGLKFSIKLAIGLRCISCNILGSSWDQDLLNLAIFLELLMHQCNFREFSCGIHNHAADSYAFIGSTIDVISFA